MKTVQLALQNQESVPECSVVTIVTCRIMNDCICACNTKCVTKYHEMTGTGGKAVKSTLFLLFVLGGFVSWPSTPGTFGAGARGSRKETRGDSMKTFTLQYLPRL
eukprot:364991-Chlamydomonas_euryale.AAC.14